MTMVETSPEWAAKARQLLKAEIARAEISYAELARRLSDMGLEENEGSVKARINRGTFPAWFLLAAAEALDLDVILEPGRRRR